MPVRLLNKNETTWRIFHKSSRYDRRTSMETRKIEFLIIIFLRWKYKSRIRFSWTVSQASRRQEKMHTLKVENSSSSRRIARKIFSFCLRKIHRAEIFSWFFSKNRIQLVFPFSKNCLQTFFTRFSAINCHKNFLLPIYSQKIAQKMICFSFPFEKLPKKLFFVCFLKITLRKIFLVFPLAWTNFFLVFPLKIACKKFFLVFSSQIALKKFFFVISSLKDAQKKLL